MGVLHVVFIDDTRTLWHTIRRINGTWFPFDDVRKELLGENPGSLNPSAFDDVDCAGVVNDLHVCLLTTNNEVVHTIRRINRSWFPFGNVRAAAKAPKGTVFSIAVTEVNGQLHMCAAIVTSARPLVSTDKTLFYTIRSSSPSGPWKPFQNCGGSFNDVTCAEAGGSLHFCGTTFESQGLRLDALEHAVRPPSAPSFTPFGDVRKVVLAQNPGSFDPGEFFRVSCAGFAGELHVCATSRGKLFHTIRRTDGTWFPFGPVVDVVITQNPGSRRPTGLGDISCAMVNGELHVICVDGAGGAWHTIRRTDGTWFPFGPVVGVVVAQNPGSPVPGRISSVAIADSF